MIDPQSKLSWKSITLDIPYKGVYKRILSNIEGEVKSGRIMALMGPSGSGKTTLLNVLSGNVESGYRTNGQILLNNEELTHDYFRQISYLYQEDYYFDYCTCKEFVEFTTLGRNRNLNMTEIRKRVKEVLATLYLKNHANTQVSKLSGGEKKRMLIACELLTNKPIIFLDEPTSGLDSHLALKIAMFLSKLAKVENRIFIVTIHQPSNTILRLFDDLTFLCDGKVIYTGPYENCSKYLLDKGIENPVDITLPEFLFEFTSQDSSFPEINQIHNQVTGILHEDICFTDNSTKSYKKIDYKLSFRVIYYILWKQFKQLFGDKNGQIMGMGLLFSLFIIIATNIMIIIGFKNLYESVIEQLNAVQGFNLQALIGDFSDQDILNQSICLASSEVMLGLLSMVLMGLIRITMREYQLVKIEIKKSIYTVSEFTIAILLFYIICSMPFIFIGFIPFLVMISTSEYLFYIKTFSLTIIPILVQDMFLYGIFFSESILGLINTIFFAAPYLQNLPEITDKFLNKTVTGAKYFTSIFPLTVSIYIVRIISNQKAAQFLDLLNRIRAVSQGFGNNLGERNTDNVFGLDKMSETKRICTLFGLTFMFFIFAFVILSYKMTGYRRIKLSLNK